MNRKVSICILVIILIILIIVIFELAGKGQGTPLPDTQMNETQEETESVIITNVNHVTNYRYIARIVDERLVIFESDGKTVYLETDIRENELSDLVQEQAINGIGFQTDASMYDFLENYSS